MRSDKKQAKHEAITKAAYALLAQKGYDGTSMLSIAKAARASNETLYRWYGDKRGLFEHMVRDNTTDIKQALENALAQQSDPVQTLTDVAPVLLTMLVGERAILLNRAACSDPTDELGNAISTGGRDVIQPLIAAVLEPIAEKIGQDSNALTTIFLSLLIGDLQIKRAIGAIPELTPPEVQSRCDIALSFIAGFGVGER